MLDDRAKLLLKALVERYIADGQPVGSRTLSRASGLELSPATIRNVMSDLEALGLIASPHTSAGRIPTDKAYRTYVDSLMRLEPLPSAELDRLAEDIGSGSSAIETILRRAAQSLGVLTQDAGKDGVERAGPDGAGRLLAHQMSDALLHFLRGLIGKGQRKDLLRRNAIAEHVGQTVRKHARLTAAGTGNDEQGAIDGFYGFGLRFIQTGQQVLATGLTWLGGDKVEHGDGLLLAAAGLLHIVRVVKSVALVDDPSATDQALYMPLAGIGSLAEFGRTRRQSIVLH